MSTLPYAWYADAITLLDSIAIPATDHGLTAGDGAFETMKLVRGAPFAQHRHLERLAATVRGLGLTEPALEDVAKAVAAVIEANGLNGATGPVVRITFTAGRGPLGSGRDPGATPTLLVIAGPAREWPPTASVWMAPWPRNERGALAGLKTTSYAENVVAFRAAQRAGADEAIFANTKGELCEGTGTNVFLEVDGQLVTPPLQSGCLDGVTRRLVLELGLALERDVPASALAFTSEAFLTSSTRDVQPIARVDGAPLTRSPGRLSVAAAAAFENLVARDVDP